MIYRPLYCPIENEKGHVCGAHLADIEADVSVSAIVRCRQLHYDRKKKMIHFTQADNGTITYREFPETQERTYAPDTIRYSD